MGEQQLRPTYWRYMPYFKHEKYLASSCKGVSSLFSTKIRLPSGIISRIATVQLGCVEYPNWDIRLALQTLGWQLLSRKAPKHKDACALLRALRHG